jgi:D-alanyl-D-alanine carboxypeptidase
MQRIAGKPLDFPPGSKFAYSNTNYIILGELIQTLAKEPYEAYMREHVFAAAQMGDTTTIAHEAGVPNMARGYVYENGKIDPAPPLADSWAWSAGNIVTTVADLEKWNAALAGGKVGSPADYALMTTPQLFNGEKTGYGFGLFVDTFEGQSRIWHNGGTFGYAANDKLFPALGTHVVVFTNDQNGPDDAISARIFNDLYPSIYAASARPVAGEDVAVTARVKSLWAGLAAGKPDRSEMSPGMSAELTDALLAQAAPQLASLGTPADFVFRGETDSASGNSKVYEYIVKFAQASIKLTAAIDKKTDKFAAFYFSAQ